MSVLADDDEFNKLQRHHRASRNPIYDMPRGDVSHVDVIRKEGAWTLYNAGAKITG